MAPVSFLSFRLLRLQGDLRFSVIFAQREDGSLPVSAVLFSAKIEHAVAAGMGLSKSKEQGSHFRGIDVGEAVS